MRLFLNGIAVVVTFCALVSNTHAQTRSAAKDSRPESTTISGHTETLRQLDQAMDDIAARVLPAVVQISVSGFGPSQKQRNGESVIARQRGIGSGVIVDSNGYIMTNAHVVTGAQHIQVVMRSLITELVPFKTSLLHKQRTFEAKLIGIHQFTDLALLKIEAQGLPFIPLKEEYKARLGQTVLAVGYTGRA
jgi:serine protease Do